MHQGCIQAVREDAVYDGGESAIGNIAIQDLYTKQKEEHDHPYYTPYNVDGHEYKIPPYCHPGTIAKRILNEIQHTNYYGVQIIAPPGNGKTTVAKVITHHLHTKASRDMNIDFTIRIEREKDTHAFRNLNHYIKTLPKKPTIVIFDDLSGVFGQMSEEEIDKNFETLTEVRWILDPAYGKIPFIPILTYHYSKVIEKKFRSQNGMSIFCRFGNEERTNLDTIAPKRSQARKAIANFQRILKTMYVNHNFEIYFDDGKPKQFITDEPFRASCMVSDDVGNVILTSKTDLCAKCDVQSKKKKIDPVEAVRELYKIYGHYGIQQLRQSLAMRGVKDAINPQAFHAMEFVENRWLPTYDFGDFKGIVDAIYKMYKTGRPRKTNRKRKLENQAMEYLNELAFSDENP